VHRNEEGTRTLSRSRQRVIFPRSSGCIRRRNHGRSIITNGQPRKLRCYDDGYAVGHAAGAAVPFRHQDVAGAEFVDGLFVFGAPLVLLPEAFSGKTTLILSPIVRRAGIPRAFVP
jgi:hypothetical protein